MKQYTTNDQTAKLIELGFEKPKNTQYVQRAKARNLYSPFIEFGEPEFEGSYSIGELIDMLPMNINNDGRFEEIIIHPNYNRWIVKYSGIFREPTYQICGKELIDVLYDMIVKLKEEKVI